MGKKVKRKTYTSKGQRRAVVAGVKEARQTRCGFDTALNKVEAWRKGLNPWITIATNQKNMPFVKKRANEVYGNPRATVNIYKGKNEDE